MGVYIQVHDANDMDFRSLKFRANYFVGVRTAEGVEVGRRVGFAEVGRKEGERVFGVTVGKIVGDIVDLVLGVLVGLEVGSAVSGSVGCIESILVGRMVGALV